MKVFCLTLLAITFSSLQTTPVSKHFHLTKLAPGIWAAIHNDNYGRAICNAGIIDLGDKTVIFDPFMTPEAAKDLKKVAKQLTSDDRLVVINSHFHNDHIRGNQVFSPEASIISTEWTRNKMVFSEPDEQQWEKTNAGPLAAAEREKLKTVTGREKEETILWLAYYEGILKSLPELKLTLPDITFSDSLWIHGKDRSIKLIEYKNGHTPSDIVLFLPEDRIAFMGDLFFVQRHPWLGDGDPEEWKKILQHLMTSPVDRFVPGHGPISGKEELQPLHDYITDVQSVVNEGFKTGLPDSVILKAQVPDKYSEWWFGRFYFYNVRSLVRRARKG